MIRTFLLIFSKQKNALLVLCMLIGATNATGGSQPAVQKFPLRISPDGHHIVDNNGTPFLMVADVAWQMLRRLSYTDAVHYMNSRKSQSFNTFLVQLLPNLPNQRNIGKVQPFQGNHIGKPNKAYFDYLEKIIIAARERDLTVGIVVSRKSWNVVFDAFKEDDWKKYGSYIGNRFSGYANVLWIVSEEEYQTSGQFRAISSGIREGGASQIIASLSTCSPNPSDNGNTNRSDLRFVIPDSTVSYAEYTALANWQKNSAEASLRPFLIANSEFPELKDKSVQIRNQAYQSIMSSAAGFCHMSTIRNFHSTWKVNIKKDGAEYIHELVKILKGIPWEYMQPDPAQTLLRDAADKSQIGVMAMSNKKMAMMYIPESRQVRLNLAYLSGQNFGIVWYSPRTGRRWTGPDVQVGSEAAIMPPDAQPGWDWIVLVGAKN